MAKGNKKRPRILIITGLYLIDSNIIIYSVLPENSFLIDLIETRSPFVSVISKIEVLGYHKLSDKQRKQFSLFFDNATLIHISENIIARAINMKQKKNISLADAVIAASALENKLTLITRNTSDFSNIQGLKLENPFNKK